MKKICVILCVAMLLLTGCPGDQDEEEKISNTSSSVNQNGDDDQVKEEESDEKQPYALPAEVIPAVVSFHELESMGYVISPMTTDGDGIYREHTSSIAKMSFSYTMTRYSESFIANGEEKRSEIEGFFTFSFGVLNPYRLDYDTSITSKIYNNAIKNKESIDEQFASQDENSANFLYVSDATMTTVESVWFKDSNIIDGNYDIIYVVTHDPYYVAIYMYGMSETDYPIVLEMLKAYATSLASDAKGIIDTSYEAYNAEE